MTSPRRYAIVGAGAAGLAAAEAIRERDGRAEITLFADEAHRPYSRPGLAYLIAKELPESALRIRTAAELADLGARWVTTRVQRIDPAHHLLLDAEGQPHAFDRVLLATGSRSVPPPFPGGQLDGVVQLDGLDDARALLRRARRARHAIVVGGGPTALELVESLRAHGVATRYFLRGERYWAGVLDPIESAIVQDRLVRAGVTLHAGTEITRAVGEAGRLRGVETKAGDRYACDLLAVCIGVASQVEPLAAAVPIEQGGVVVDDHLCASPDVFAAGDVARVRDGATGALRRDVLWNTALEQGRVAGANMAGETLPYAPSLSLNVTRLVGVALTVIGSVGVEREADLIELSRGESQAWRDHRGARSLTLHRGSHRLRVLVQRARLVGAVVLGDQAPSRRLVRAMRRDVDLSPIEAQLVEDRAGGVDRLLTFLESAERGDDAPARP